MDFLCNMCEGVCVCVIDLLKIKIGGRVEGAHKGQGKMSPFDFFQSLSPLGGGGGAKG